MGRIVRTQRRARVVRGLPGGQPPHAPSLLGIKPRNKAAGPHGRAYGFRRGSGPVTCTEPLLRAVPRLYGTSSVTNLSRMEDCDEILEEVLVVNALRSPAATA